MCITFLSHVQLHMPKASFKLTTGTDDAFICNILQKSKPSYRWFISQETVFNCYCHAADDCSYYERVETMKLVSAFTALDMLSGLSDALKLLLNIPGCCSFWRRLTDLPNTSYILECQMQAHTRIKIIPHDSCFPRGSLPSVLHRWNEVSTQVAWRRKIIIIIIIKQWRYGIEKRALSSERGIILQLIHFAHCWIRSVSHQWVACCPNVMQ